ncbi:MAG: 23S rRNA (guanosine(2251)-2'-O)-methyltransferase RlmB [Bacteroidetes bacterium]|jgi:23S rRNA (guanosine2251-2'-O)-methyltransferase|nr:23S rRNA (guanosine(2251)-2'-O)-methyltransferase RlmB [Bacteroidota bacterium]
MYPPRSGKKDFIFGIRAVLEAIGQHKEIEKILIKKGLKGELYGELIQLIRARELPHQFVPEEKINSITRKNHQGILAYVSPIEYQQLESVIPMIYEKGENPFLIILDGITDVRNLGAIARTAECAGVHALVIPTRKTAQINADAIKTSAGALHNLNVCRSQSLANTCEYLVQSGIQLIAVTEKGNVNYPKADLSVPTALVLGSEDEGISTGLLKLIDQQVSIPVFGEINSLNVSVAAGILMYEVIRQRVV